MTNRKARRSLKIPGGFGEKPGPGDDSGAGSALPPVMDFSGFYGSDLAAVEDVFTQDSFDYSDFQENWDEFYSGFYEDLSYSFDYGSYGSGFDTMPIYDPTGEVSYHYDYSDYVYSGEDFSGHDGDGDMDGDGGDMDGDGGDHDGHGDEDEIPECMLVCETELQAYEMAKTGVQETEPSTHFDKIADAMCAPTTALNACVSDNCPVEEAEEILKMHGIYAEESCWCEKDSYACDAVFGGNPAEFEPVAPGSCAYRCHTAIMKADSLCEMGQELSFPGENETWPYNPFEFNIEFENVGCAFPTPAAVEARVKGSLTLGGLTVPDKETNHHAFMVMADVLAMAIEKTVGGDAVAEIISIGGVMVHDDHDEHDGHDHGRLLEKVKIMKMRKLAAVAVDFELRVFNTCESACAQSDTDGATAQLESLTGTLSESIADSPEVFQEALVEAAETEAYYSGVTLDMSSVVAQEVAVQEVEVETQEAYVPPEPAPPTAEDLMNSPAATLKIGFSVLVAAAVAFIAL